MIDSSGLGNAGRALYDDVTSRYSLDVPEMYTLLQAARLTDALDRLAALVANREVVESLGNVQPAIIEMRQSSQAVAKLIATLRLPDEDGQQAQRRGGARGNYGTGASPIRIVKDA